MAMYFAFRTATFVTRLVPLRLSYALARAAGILAYYAWAGGRRRCVQNMLHVAGGDRRLARRYARRSFSNYVVYLIDFFRFMGISEQEIEHRVDFEGWDLIEAQRDGNGIVFITIHFGNWDMGAAILALKGFPISVIADTFPNADVNRLVIGSREHLGMKVIPAQRMGPGILHALRRNDLVAMLIDVPTEEHSVEVDFFGATIAVSDGPARIALRAGSSVVAATLPRIQGWDDRVTADVAPVRYEPTGDREHDVRALTQAVFRELERFVLRDPTQWYIFRNLWLADRRPQPAA